VRPHLPGLEADEVMDEPLVAAHDGPTPSVPAAPHADAPPQASVPAQAVAAPFPATPLFSAAWEEYREDGLSIRKATAGNLAHERSSLTLWLAIVGDRPLGDCARGDAAAFRRTVARLPKDYHRNKRWRGKTFAQMTPAADARDKDESRRIARIEIKTVNRHLPLSATPSCRPFDETHPSNTIRGESEIV
jgi:hypothetical protein